MESKLLNLVSKFEALIKKSEYGGPGPFELPSNHQAGMIVPYGGSSCANCKFLVMKENGPHCNSAYFINWNGSNSRLPVDDPATYCSDWYESK